MSTQLPPIGAADSVMPQKPYGIIYCVLHLTSGRRYIGQTMDTAWNRWRSHIRNSRRGTNIYFWNAIRKYGENAFRVEQIDSADTKESLDQKENYWIEFYEALNPDKGFNCKTGGHKPVYTQDARKRMGEKTKEQFKKKGKWPRTGIPSSPEQIRRCSFQTTRHYVKCVQTGEVFASAQRASKLLKIDSNGIYKAIRRGTKVSGYNWVFVDKSSIAEEHVSYDHLRCEYTIKRNRRLFVTCVQTGEKWEYAKHAARSVNMGWTAFMGAMNRKESINGLNFVYSEQP